VTGRQTNITKMKHFRCWSAFVDSPCVDSTHILEYISPAKCENAEWDAAHLTWFYANRSICGEDMREKKSFTFSFPVTLTFLN